MSESQNTGPNQDAEPSPQSPIPAGEPGQTTGNAVGMTGLPANVAAGLAALFPLVGGLIVFLIEKKDAYARFHAMQSIYFGVALVVANVVLTIASVVLAFIPVLGWLIGVVLWGGLAVAGFIFWLLHVVKAFSGQEWEMPIIGKMVRSQLAE